MRHTGQIDTVLFVGELVLLLTASSEAQPFYTGSGNNMFRVFGCAPNTTLNLNGTGPSQQGECTLYQTNTVVPAVPIESWVSAQVNAVLAQNEKLQRQVDELTARVQALEAAASRSPRGATPRTSPGAGTR